MVPKMSLQCWMILSLFLEKQNSEKIAHFCVPALSKEEEQSGVYLLSLTVLLAVVLLVKGTLN